MLQLRDCQAWAESASSSLSSSLSDLSSDLSADFQIAFGKAQSAPKETMYLILAALLLSYSLTRLFLLAKTKVLQKRSLSARPSTPDLEKPAARGPGSSFKAPQRPLGVWIPDTQFKRPTAPPAQDWNVQTTAPNPYRPFRWGKYHITMGLRNMKWDDWIELDNEFPKFHADKAKRIVERGSKCSYTSPDAVAQTGAHELLSELRDYVCERYPSLYTRTEVGLNNLLTGEVFNTVERPLKEDPMQMCARLVQDDLAIMFEKEDGQYYLLAGSILLAGFWRLEDKLGMPLSEIHTSGDVPGYKEKLEKGMMNFFRRVQPNGPVQRNNYFIQVDSNLPWSDSIGSEDSPHISWDTASKETIIENHHFRSERQSLRRLPISGGVVFTIRTYFVPITELCDELGVPGRLASAVRSWGDNVAKYKGRERYGHVLLEYLDRRDREQRESGLVPAEDGEDGDAGIRGYPF